MLLLRLRFYDTQNGFKGISSDLFKEVSPYLREPGFAFDTELLWISALLGAKIKEMPIYWKDSYEKSNINFVPDTFNMLRAILKQYSRRKKEKNILNSIRIYNN